MVSIEQKTLDALLFVLLVFLDGFHRIEHRLFSSIPVRLVHFFNGRSFQFVKLGN